MADGSRSNYSRVDHSRENFSVERDASLTNRLRVTNVASAVLPDGKSLHDHVRITAELFEEDVNAFDSWEATLFCTGYDPENNYENRRWVLGTNDDYEVIEGFPRIAAPLIQGVEKVRYSINLSACEEFRLEDELLDLIK